MRCSECSMPVRPIVAVDIDGTLAGYHAQLARFARDYWNLPPLGSWSGSGNFEDFLGLTQLEYREAKLAYRQGGYKRIAPIYDKAKEFMESLSSDLEIEIWITTTRPWSRLDNVDPDTKFWLSRHKIKFDHLLFDDDKYRVLGEIVDPGRVVAVLDDLPEQYDRAVACLPSACVMMLERPHNMVDRADRQTVSGYAQALEKIETSLRVWRDRNER